MKWKTISLLLALASLAATNRANTQAPAETEIGVVQILWFVFALILVVLWVLLPAILYEQLRTLRKIERHLRQTSNAPVPLPPTPPTPPIPEPQPAPVPQPAVRVEIQCPTCHHPFTVDAGIKTNCPRCGENVIAE